MTTAFKKLYNERTLWNVAFSALFLSLVVISIEILEVLGRMPESISVFEFFILSLAAFRLTRMVVYDLIMQWFRDLFSDLEYKKLDTGEEEVKRNKPARGPRRTVYELLNCPWCFGLWAAWMVAFLYHLAPELGWFLVLMLAISGVASSFQILANLIGWHAEAKKLEMQSKQDFLK